MDNCMKCATNMKQTLISTPAGYAQQKLKISTPVGYVQQKQKISTPVKQLLK